jgi:uncharacterized protein YdeI (YjbR/CyaY-like superfamily)
MEITETLDITNRAEWRQWLQQNHATAKEIWLIRYNSQSEKAGIPYLHAVEEALCFGWIDGIQKKLDAGRSAQRFTPRRKNGNWTELNKERARRLIASGLMTDAGLAVLPDMTQEDLVIAEDIQAALQADPQTWDNFQRFPEIYRRIRIGYIEEMRSQPQEFQQRLEKFVQKTRENKTFGSFE